jgi:hypothetical protein
MPPSSSALLLLPSWYSSYDWTTQEIQHMAKSMPTDMWELKSTLNALLNPVLMESVILFFSTEFWGSFCIKLLCIYALKIIYDCQLHDFIPHCDCEMFHLQDTTSIQPLSLSTSSTQIFALGAFCATAWNICWCQNQKVVICSCSVLDNMQCCVP